MNLLINRGGNMSKKELINEFLEGDSSGVLEDANGLLKKGEPLYSMKGIYELGEIKLDNSFDSGYVITQQVNVHSFLMGMKDQSDDGLGKVYDQVKLLNGEFITDNTFGSGKILLSITDYGGYGDMFLNYVKLYKLLKGLKHYHSKRVYRIVHKDILSASDELKVKINKELRPIRGVINGYGEIVISQLEIWDYILIDAVKYCIGKALGINLPEIPKEELLTFGEPIPTEKLIEGEEIELNYMYSRRVEIEEEIEKKTKKTETKKTKKASKKSTKK